MTMQHLGKLRRIAKVNEATVALKQAKHDLIPDKTLLNNAKTI